MSELQRLREERRARALSRLREEAKTSPSAARLLAQIEQRSEEIETGEAPEEQR